jgi:hypothetical protein
MRAFLMNVFTWRSPFAGLPRFLHHAFYFDFRSALARIATHLWAKMGGIARRVVRAPTPPPPAPEPRKRRMVHLKTKEECRLGNETIQVWAVELPSKHAEGILKYVLHLVINHLTAD